MKKMLARWTACIGFCLVLGGLSACGGSDDPGAKVTLTNVSFQPIKAEVLSDQEGGVSGALSFRLVGDKALFNASSIHVRVEDPNEWFYARQFEIDPQTGTGQLNLVAEVAYAKLGLNSGSLRISFCFDSQCQSPIGNSTVVLPYAVHVIRALSVDIPRVDLDGIQLAGAFGTTTSPLSIPVILPEGTTSWKVEIAGQIHVQGRASSTVRRQDFSGGVFNGGTPIPDNDSVVLQSSASMTPQFWLIGQLRKVGIYYAYLDLTAAYTTPSGEKRETSKSLLIQYVVSPSPSIPYVASPTSFSFEVVSDFGYQTQQLDTLIPSFDWPAVVEYLPPDGSGNLDAGDQRWLKIEGNSTGGAIAPLWGRVDVTAWACNVQDETGWHCLSAGYYKAIVRIAVAQGDGTNVELALPVSLIVKP